MRLLIYAYATAPGGGLTNLLGLLEGWRESGRRFAATVIASHPETIRALRKASGTHAIYAVPPMDEVRRLMWEYLRLPDLIRRLQVDVVMTTNYALPRLGIPQLIHHQSLHPWTVGAEPGRPGPSLKRRLQHLAARRSMKVAALNVFISDYVRVRAEEAVKSAPGGSRVIYYGISKVFEEVCRRIDRPPFPTYGLCAIQSPAESKDTESLLTAFAALVRDEPDLPWSLDIAEVGDLQRWKERARRLGVDARIRWCGFLGPGEIAEMLRRRDCLIYPSVFEGFGLPIIEAMACGCPVIAVDSSAIPEIAAGVAALVPPRNPEAIVSSIRAIYRDENLRRRMCEAGTERARRFTWPASADAFYRECAEIAKAAGYYPHLSSSSAT